MSDSITPPPAPGPGSSAPTLPQFNLPTSEVDLGHLRPVDRPLGEGSNVFGGKTPPLPPSPPPSGSQLDPDSIWSGVFPQRPGFDPQNPLGDAPSGSGSGSGSGGGHPATPPSSPPGDSSVDLGGKPPSHASTLGESSLDVIFRPDAPGVSPSSGDSFFRVDAPLFGPSSPTGHADIDATPSAAAHGGGGGHTPGRLAKLGGLLDFLQVAEGIYRDGAELFTGQPNAGFINPAIEGTQVGNVLNNVAQASPITTGAIQSIEHHAGHTVASTVSIVATPVQVGELVFNGGVKIGQNIANEIGYTDHLANGLIRLGAADAINYLDDLFG